MATSKAVFADDGLEPVPALEVEAEATEKSLSTPEDDAPPPQGEPAPDERSNKPAQKKPAPRILLLLTEKASSAPTAYRAPSPTGTGYLGAPGSRHVTAVRHEEALQSSGGVQIFCGDAKIKTEITDNAIDYKIECAGEIRVENNGATIECSRLVYEKGFLTLDDVTLRRNQPQGGLFTEMRAKQLTIKYAVANVALQREPKKQPTLVPRAEPDFDDDDFEEAQRQFDSFAPPASAPIPKRKSRKVPAF